MRIRSGDRFLQQRLPGEGALELGVEGAVFEVDERSEGREAAADDTETGFDGGPDEEVVVYVWMFGLAWRAEDRVILTGEIQRMGMREVAYCTANAGDDDSIGYQSVWLVGDDSLKRTLLPW